jgi:acyl carrier protein
MLDLIRHRQVAGGIDAAGILTHIQQERETFSRIHERYMNEHATYVRTLGDATQPPHEPVSVPPVSPTMTQAAEPVPELPLAVPELTPPAAYEAFAASPVTGNGWTEVVPAMPAASKEQTAVSSQQADSVAVYTDGLLDIVSEKTGYPAQALGLEMDMEADLGIDSIKRVEILAALRDRFPETPPIRPEDLTDLRTLADVVASLGLPDADGRPAGPATMPGSDTPPPLPVYAVQTQPLPPPDMLEARLPDGYSCLLISDGTELTLHLATLLGDLGGRVHVLHPPAEFVSSASALPPYVAQTWLRSLEEDDLHAGLFEVVRLSGPVGAFVHLHPMLSSDLISARDEALVRAVFIMAGRVAGSIQDAVRQSFGCWITVIRLDGAFGTSGRAAFGAVPGGLAGMTKTLRLEWPGVACRAIDLDPRMPSLEAARSVMAEIRDPDRRLVEVGYGPAGRITLAIEPDGATAPAGE